MVAKVSSNFAQVILAGLAALVFAFPTPQEAYKAFAELFERPQPVTISVEPELAVVRAAPDAEPIVLRMDEAQECLALNLSDPEQNLERCAMVLYRHMLTSGVTPVPNFQLMDTRHSTFREDEEARLALANVCRAIWKANNGRWDKEVPLGCQRITAIETKSLIE